VGVHELSLYLDPGNLYQESDETDNVFTRSFTVVSLK